MKNVEVIIRGCSRELTRDEFHRIVALFPEADCVTVTHDRDGQGPGIEVVDPFRMARTFA